MNHDAPGPNEKSKMKRLDGGAKRIPLAAEQRYERWGSPHRVIYHYMVTGATAGPHSTRYNRQTKHNRRPDSGPAGGTCENWQNDEKGLTTTKALL